MIVTELQEINEYWNKKYPLMDIRLWCNKEETKYFGQMINKECNMIFEAETIGKLISLGEVFLRTFK